MKKTSVVKVKRVSVPKRKKTHRRRRGLSAGSSTSLMNGLKSSAAAGAGGYLATYINGFVPDKFGVIGKLAAGVVLGAVISVYANQPNIGAGVTAGMVALNNPTKGLSEFAEEDALNEEPLYLSENGTPLVLAEDGNFYAQ